MPVWFAVMCGFYLVAVALCLTAVARVLGDHWRTSGRWLLAGWAFWGIGFAVATGAMLR